MHTENVIEIVLHRWWNEWVRDEWWETKTRNQPEQYDHVIQCMRKILVPFFFKGFSTKKETARINNRFLPNIEKLIIHTFPCALISLWTFLGDIFISNEVRSRYRNSPSFWCQGFQEFYIWVSFQFSDVLHISLSFLFVSSIFGYFEHKYTPYIQMYRWITIPPAPAINCSWRLPCV